MPADQGDNCLNNSQRGQLARKIERPVVGDEMLRARRKRAVVAGGGWSVLVSPRRVVVC